MKKILLVLPLLSIGNLCFAPSGSGDSNWQGGKAKVEILNQRQDLTVAGGGKQFVYNRVGLLGEVPQGADAVNSQQFLLIIGAQFDQVVAHLAFEVYVAGALATVWKPDPIFGFRTIPTSYNYVINGKEYPGSTVVLSVPDLKDVVLWGNSPMGSKAQASQGYHFPNTNNGPKITVVYEVVYEWGERKAKIYIQ